MEARTFLLKFNSEGRHLRIATLTQLRWLALFGQLATVLAVAFGLQFSTPTYLCLGVIGCSAVLNVIVDLYVPKHFRLGDARATALLTFDVVQLSVLLYLSGGLENPFAFLLLAPVTIASVSLRSRQILFVVLLVVLCASILSLFHWPLPWYRGESILLPPLYRLGLWISLLVATAFICTYAGQVAREARSLNLALTAAELALERQNHLSRLDGLAAAAAHELGTPLATIALVSRELSKSHAGREFVEDVELLNQEAQRCRSILRRLASLADERQPQLDRMKLRQLLENCAASCHRTSVAIRINAQGDGAEPIITNNPAFTYGIGNFLENAVDFAKSEVIVNAIWTEDHVTVSIVDDGPGFPSEIVERVGEPYLRSKTPRRLKTAETSGLGLGIFIAKTLLERTGAELSFANQENGGAVVEMVWRRRRFETANSDLIS